MLLLLGFLLPGTILAATIHVPGDAASIQSGINLSTDGDTVLVAEGVYNGSGNSGIRFGGKHIIVLSASGPAATRIEPIDTLRAFIFNQQEDSLAILDGFTISGGYETVDDWLSPYRGGIAIDSASPVIRNCIFRDSFRESGGGIYIDGGSPQFENCTIVNNQADVRGGGIYANGELVRFSNCTIERNKVYGQIDFWLAYGGGVFNVGGLSMRNCLITGNRVDHVSFVPSATDYALAQGGAIYSLAGRLTLDSCIISHNSSGTAGGILAGLEVTAVSNSVFFNNTADIYAGLVYLTPREEILGELALDHCTFACNYSARIASDGVALINNPTASGLRLRLPEELATDIADATEGTAAITNTLFAFSGSTPIVSETDGAVTIAYNNIWHTVSGPDFGGNLADLTGIDGNLATDPLFCDISDSGLSLDSLSPLVTADMAGAAIGARSAGCGIINDAGASLYTAILNSAGATANQQILDSVFLLLSPWDTLAVVSDSGRADINYMQIDYPMYILGPRYNAGPDFILGEDEFPAKRAVVYIRDFCVLAGLTIEGYEFSDQLLGYNAINCAESPAIIDQCVLSATAPDAAFANFDGTPLVRNTDLVDGLSVFGEQDIVVSYNFWDCIDNACITDKIQSDSLFFTGRVKFSPFLDDIPTPVEDTEPATVPHLISLDQNFPNPFNPSTTIQFTLRRSSGVTVDVLNILGQRVAVLLRASLPAGRHHVVWNGSRKDGSAAASGVYLYRITADDNCQTRKMLLLK